MTRPAEQDTKDFHYAKRLIPALDMMPVEFVPVPKTWPEGLRTAVVSMLYAFWSAQKGDYYDCVDNHRFARAGDPDEVKAYIEARKTGCCGQVDDMWVMGDVIVLYGFDHGH